MGQVGQVGMGIGVVEPFARGCPLCGKAVTPDALGFVECACGWGGPDDPLEMGHGLGLAWRRLDRKVANRRASKDLRLLRTQGKRAATIGLGYTAVLFVVSTCIYLLLLAALAASLYFGYRFVLDRAWVGVGLCALGAGAVAYMLFRAPARHKGVVAAPTQYPRLAAALAEVSQRVGAPMPHRIVLTPHAEAFVYSHRPLRGFFRRELVLGLGAGALPLLSETDLKAVLAHELAHYRHGHTLLHRYFGYAEAALARLIYILHSGPRPSRRVIRMRRDGTVFADMAMDLLTLPVRAVWIVFHLLRLHESRTAEFAADRTAADAYGARSVINGLTGISVAGDTLRGAGRSLLAEMRKHGSTNVYAELRAHYASLSPALIAELRLKAAQDFRSLERTHPSTPDRLRAVYALGVQPASAAERPAVELLVPEGADTADGIESALTALWQR